jgi:hypothetical protein
MKFPCGGLKGEVAIRPTTASRPPARGIFWIRSRLAVIALSAVPFDSAAPRYYSTREAL